MRCNETNPRRMVAAMSVAYALYVVLMLLVGLSGPLALFVKPIKDGARSGAWALAGAALSTFALFGLAFALAAGGRSFPEVALLGDLSALPDDGAFWPAAVWLAPVLLALLGQTALLGYLRRLRHRFAERTEQMQRTMRRAALLATTARAGAWEWRAATGRLEVSRGWLDLLGLLPEDAPRSLEEWLALVHPADRTAFAASLGARAAVPPESEQRWRHADEGWVWLLNRVQAVRRAGAPDDVTLFGVALDITERKRAELGLAHAATHDALTDLPNRRYFQHHVEAALAAASASGDAVALGLLDLDGFKPINDRLGHAAGDEVLQAIGGRLWAEVRDHGVAARLGGDEFALLIACPCPRPRLRRFAERLRRALTAPIRLSTGETARVGASIGLVVADGGPPSDLLARADAALYRAKAKGGNLCCFWDAPDDFKASA